MTGNGLHWSYLAVFRIFDTAVDQVMILVVINACMRNAVGLAIECY